MAELPTNWGLKTKKRLDGKLDIVGKDDTGKEYKVRTTESSHVTDHDIREIAAVDREQTTAKEFVDGVIANQKKHNKDREDSMQDDFTAAAEDIIGQCTTNSHATRPGMIDLPLKIGGYSRQGRENFDNWIKSLEN